jgi:hypothetical protein
MVIVKVPRAAVLLAVNRAVLVAVAGSGVKVTVTPLGKPEADRETLPEKPFEGVMLTVVDTLEPRRTDKLLGEADKLKLPAAGEVTVRVTVVVRLVVPEVPVTVIG